TEVEGVVADERGRPGHGQVYQAAHEAPPVAVRVHGTEGQPGGVRAVRPDRAVFGGQHEAVPRGVGRHADGASELAAQVAVDAQLRQARAVDAEVGEHRRVGEAAKAGCVRGASGDV